MKALKAQKLYDGKSLKSNVYVIFDEKITKVTEKKPECEVIGEGVVTPAFIDGHSHIGLARAGEPSYEEETNDELSQFLPLNKAIDSVYMDDTSFRESVESGVLYSHIMAGSGNLIGGKTCVIRNWADSVDKAFFREIGMKAALGYNPRSTKEWKGERPTTRMGTIGLLRREFTKAKKTEALVRLDKKSMDEVDPVTEEIMKIVSGKTVLMVHVHKSDDIEVLLSLVSEFGLRVVANHCGDVYSAETWKKLKDSGIPVIYGPIDSFSYKVELKHSSWRNVASLLSVKPDFGLMTDHPVVLQRDLFMQLRHFLKFGMNKEEAISVITQNNARILGLEELGTIEKGKLASLVLWNRDPFEMGSYPELCIGEGKVVHEE